MKYPSNRGVLKERLYSSESLLKMSRLTTSFFLHLELTEGYSDDEELLVAFDSAAEELYNYLERFNQQTSDYHDMEYLVPISRFFQNYLRELYEFDDLKLTYYLRWLLRYQMSLSIHEKNEFYGILEKLYNIRQTQEFYTLTREFLLFIKDLKI